MRTVYYRAEDTGRGRRAVLAIAGSIATHEVLLGVIVLFALFTPPAPKADAVVAQRITVVIHRPTPSPPPPTPPPRPVATPRIALTTKTFNQARPKAAATPAEHTGGAAAPRRPVVAQHRRVIVPVHPQPQHVALAANPSVQNGNAAGVANGGSGTGGGAGNGTGGAGGSDSGTSGNGNSAGEDVPLTPCGAVYLDPVRTVTNSDGSQYVQVRLRVQTNDGQELRDTLGWYFYYKKARDNPFEDRRDDIRAPMQFPPPGYDLRDNQNEVTVFALKHTRPNGSTDLPDCPETKASPPPG
jgi:hypothetical protein